MDENTYDTFEHLGYIVELHYDLDPINPREDRDIDGTLMVQFSDRYRPPSNDDKAHPLYGKVQEAWERGSRTWKPTGAFTGSAHDPDKVERYARAFLGAGGVAWWDDPRGESRLVTLVFADSDYTEPQAAANALMAEYAAWSQGEVYGYVIKDRDGNDLDEIGSSVWGFIGEDGEKDMREQAKAEIDAMVAERHANRVEMFRNLVNHK